MNLKYVDLNYEVPIKKAIIPLWTTGKCKRCAGDKLELADGLCLHCYDKTL